MLLQPNVAQDHQCQPQRSPPENAWHFDVGTLGAWSGLPFAAHIVVGFTTSRALLWLACASLDTAGNMLQAPQCQREHRPTLDIPTPPQLLFLLSIHAVDKAVGGAGSACKIDSRVSYIKGCTREGPGAEGVSACFSSPRCGMRGMGIRPFCRPPRSW